MSGVYRARVFDYGIVFTIVMRKKPYNYKHYMALQENVVTCVIGNKTFVQSY